MWGRRRRRRRICLCPQLSASRTLPAAVPARAGEEFPWGSRTSVACQLTKTLRARREVWSHREKKKKKKHNNHAPHRPVLEFIPSQSWALIYSQAPMSTWTHTSVIVLKCVCPLALLFIFRFVHSTLAYFLQFLSWWLRFFRIDTRNRLWATQKSPLQSSVIQAGLGQIVGTKRRWAALWTQKQDGTVQGS